MMSKCKYLNGINDYDKRQLDSTFNKMRSACVRLYFLENKYKAKGYKDSLDLNSYKNESDRAEAIKSWGEVLKISNELDFLFSEAD